jgi:transposase
MEEEVKTEAEVVGDIGVLLGFLKQMSLPELLDRHIKKHHRDQGLSWGWVISIWLVYIVSQGDHRKVVVEDWVAEKQELLEFFTGLAIRRADFTDDRLAIALRHLSSDECWNAIEQDIAQNMIRVYELPQETVRVDATTVSGYHRGGERSLWQYGHSKDDPALRQIKLMMAALDPLGLPLAMTIVSGECADDPLYLPVIKEACQMIGKPGLLFVGDSKMSALSTRSWIDQALRFYLMPLALVGETGQLMQGWITTALQNEASLLDVLIEGEDGKTEKMARGYEVSRTCTDGTHHWEERVLIVQSLAWQSRECKSLEERLGKAEAEILALTPPIGRGKRQIRDESALVKRAEAIVRRYRVEGLLSYTYERESRTKEQLVGRGRDGLNRERKTVEVVRYQVSGVHRNIAAITEAKARAGWRAYATNAPSGRLTFRQAVLEYRQEFRVERVFGRIKGDRLCIAPMFVTREDQVLGLPRLLSLGVRLLTLVEFVARQSVREEDQPIAGLYPGQPSKTTKEPTAERLLQALAPIKLIKVFFRDRTVYQIDGFSELQKRIVKILRLPSDLYTMLKRTIIHVKEAVIAA